MAPDCHVRVAPASADHFKPSGASVRELAAVVEKVDGLERDEVDLAFFAESPVGEIYVAQAEIAGDGLLVFSHCFGFWSKAGLFEEVLEGARVEVRGGGGLGWVD